MVHILSPYREDKNLGLAYNEAMSRIPDDDFACLHDIDVSFLTPDAGVILNNYAKMFQNAHILTCFTNRVSPVSKGQLLGGKVSENFDHRHHIELAEQQKAFLYKATPLREHMSGMLMLISKKNWLKLPFTESGKCLGVDTDYWRACMKYKKQILRMDGLYIFHSYRIRNGINDKSHLT